MPLIKVPSTAVRIEWCRARACAMRWSEEVDLLREEMRRILAFLWWAATRWRTQGRDMPGLDQAQREGVIAYAERQAVVRERLLVHFNHLWRYVDRWLELGASTSDDDS